MPRQIYHKGIKAIIGQQPTWVRPHIKTRLAVMAIIAGLLWGSSTFAATVLEQIDVVTSRYGTELKLHADQPIAHKVLKATDQEMMIRFSGVVPTHTVKTNFAQAHDVSHVIFQPDGSDNLKLMIRGKALGQPVIQVVYPTYESPKTSSYRTSQAVPNTATSAITAPKPIEVNLPAESEHAAEANINSSPEPTVTATDAIGPEATPQDLPTVASDTVLPQPTPQQNTTAIANQEQVLDAQLFGTENDSYSEEALMPTAIAASPSTTDLLLEQLGQIFRQIDAGSTIISISTVMILLAGLGLFLKYKWDAIQQFTDGRPRRKTSRHRGRSSIRTLMNQQRAESESDADIAEDEQENFSPRRHPKKANHWASRPSTRVNQPVNQKVAKATPQPTSRPARTTTKRQALNSYQRSNSAVRPTPTMKPNTPQTPARSSLKKSSPAGNTNEPLPTNPRITNFLKDVAQYMERDGETGKAQRIHRNIPRE